MPGNESWKIRYELIPYVFGSGVDLGCGDVKAMAHMLGIDIRPIQDPAHNSVIMDARKLRVFADASLDFVFSGYLLDQLEEPVEVLKEWWRVIKEEHALILYLPDKKAYPPAGNTNADPLHRNDWDPADIENLMLEVGDWDLVEAQERLTAPETSMLLVFVKKHNGFGHKRTCRDPKPPKRAGLFRSGAYGDAIWASSPAAELKKQGYHVTMYCGINGAQVLRADPNIDRIIPFTDDMLSGAEYPAFWIWEGAKYDHWTGFTGVVETHLLPIPTESRFYWRDEFRHMVMNKNYLEEMHDLAGLPHVFEQRFYPAPDELSWAKRERGKYPEPVIGLCPSGSSLPKFWGYAQDLMRRMAERKVHVFVIGDLKGSQLEERAPYDHVIGTTWDIRKALTFLQQCDVVVGEESVGVNAVAMEDMRKIVLLSHSSEENLTKHWKNTVALHAEVKCYPCHRIHPTWRNCYRDSTTGMSLCQAPLTPDVVEKCIVQYLENGGSPNV